MVISSKRNVNPAQTQEAEVWNKCVTGDEATNWADGFIESKER